jgi:hypothetical protein
MRAWKTISRPLYANKGKFMRINIEQAQRGVMAFVENEIARNAAGFNKFVTYFAMPIIGKKVHTAIQTLSESGLAEGIIDENKNVDLDTVYNMAKSAITKSGQFVYYGVVFTETDIDKLYTYLKNTAS